MLPISPGWVLSWLEPVRVQSQHFDDYRQALDVLKTRKLVYPCFCTRREIMEENAAAGYAPHWHGQGDGQAPDGPIYPGTCRHMKADEVHQRLASGIGYSWRFDVRNALQETGELSWHDCRRGKIDVRPAIVGDVVLARKDTPTSYHLSVTVDDHMQGVTLVTRGEDLFAATHIHRLLQAVLGYSTPAYDHHPLMCDTEGKRFAKRDKSRTLRALRDAGKSADDIRAMIRL